jgi:hypothetical protein
MMAALFPLDMLGEQANLLTAIVLGFGFGFALERAGFGSPRKLAAQFYLYDMSVFKVMFTAILVAMVGFYAGAAFGWVDLARMWIVPTFMWAQLVGGFLLGVGFIVSGLCPGTAVVSLASGRIDAAVAFAGVVFGTFLFALLIAWFPGVQRLYEGGSLGASVLPAVLRVPAPWLALGVVVMAGLAFAGAEKVERRFQAARAKDSGASDTSAPASIARQAPQAPSRGRWALVGALALVAIVAGSIPAARSPAPEVSVERIEPLQLADALIAGEPNLMLIDLRSDAGPASGIPPSIPGAVRPAAGQSVAALLEAAAPGADIVLIDAGGVLANLPGDWPRGPRYRILRGGYDAWEQEVLTPRPANGLAPGELATVLRQNGIASYFSGAKFEAVQGNAPPPTAAPSAGGKPKKAGGC